MSNRKKKRDRLDRRARLARMAVPRPELASIDTFLAYRTRQELNRVPSKVLGRKHNTNIQ